MSKASVGHGVELKSGGKTSAFGEVWRVRGSCVTVCFINRSDS